MAFVTNLQGSLETGKFDEGGPSGSRNANITIGIPGGVESGEWGNSNVSVAKVNRDGPDSIAKQNVNNSIIDASKDFNNPASAKIKMTTSPLFGPGASEDGVDGTAMQTTWTTFQNNDLRAGKFNPTNPPLTKWSSRTAGADLGAYDIELGRDVDMDRYAGTDTATDEVRAYFTLMAGGMPRTTVHENPTYMPRTLANRAGAVYTPCKCGYPGDDYAGIPCETGRSDICGTCGPIGAKRQIFSGVHGRASVDDELRVATLTMYTGLWVLDTFSYMGDTVAVNGKTWPIRAGGPEPGGDPHFHGQWAMDWRHREGAIPCLSGQATSNLMGIEPGTPARRWVANLGRDNQNCGRNFNRGNSTKQASDYRLCDYPSGLPIAITCPDSQGYEERMTTSNSTSIRGSGRNCAWAHRLRWVGTDSSCSGLGDADWCGETGWTQTFYEGDPCCSTASGKLFGCYIDYEGVLNLDDADFDPCYKVSTLEPIGQSIITNGSADSCDCNFRKVNGPIYGPDWSGANNRDNDAALLPGDPNQGQAPNSRLFPTLVTGCSPDTADWTKWYVMASGSDTEPYWSDDECAWWTYIQEARVVTGTPQGNCATRNLLPPGQQTITYFCPSGAPFAYPDRNIFSFNDSNYVVDYRCCGDTLNDQDRDDDNYCARKYDSGNPRYLRWAAETGPLYGSFLALTGSDASSYPSATGRNWKLTSTGTVFDGEMNSRDSDNPADCSGCGWKWMAVYYDCNGNETATTHLACVEQWSREGEQDLCPSSSSVCSGVFENGSAWVEGDSVCYTEDPSCDCSTVYYMVSDTPYFSGDINGSISGTHCSWIVPIDEYVDAMPSGPTILALEHQITTCMD